MSKRKPYEFAAPAPEAKVYWSSLDELGLSSEQVAELQKERTQEFPEGASELKDEPSRRTFLSLMSAGIALATMQGCRRPLENIVPYTRMPENVIPGVPSHYATVANIRGEAVGLIIESHEGRPTKVEGNPDHPGSLGGADMQAQSSVLDLYDPDRSRQPALRGDNKTWNEFDAAFAALVATHVGNGGQGLRVLSQSTLSPTFVRLRDEVLRRFPQARFHTFDSASNSNAREGARLAYGVPVTTVYAFDRARVIVSLDSDFLQTEPGAIRNMRAFADGRRLRETTDQMNRLYQIESVMTTTGANADHRLRLGARDVAQYAKALAGRLATEHHLDLGEVGAAVNGAAAPEGVPAHWIEAVARDLFNARGQSLVVAGRKQPAAVHALAHALNEALGNVGHTLVHGNVADQAEAEHIADLRALCDAMGQHQVNTLIILGGNPVFNAPGDLDFAGKLASVENVVHLSMFRDETSERAGWHVPRAHYLETWGDARATDGTSSVQQPLIAPLYAARSEIEILGILADVPARRGYDLVQATLRGPEAIPADDRPFQRAWRRALNRGVLAAAAPAPMTGLTVHGGDIATQLRALQPGTALSRSNIEVVFQVDAKLHDGHNANNAWMVELPDPITKIVWDNIAAVSPHTASELGIRSGDKITLAKGGRSITVAAWILPGQADNSITVTLGWGHRHGGRIAEGHGFDVHPLRTTDGFHFMDGVTVTNTHEHYRVVQTQEHHRMENRPLALEATLDEYRNQPRFAQHASPTPRTLPLWREVNYNGHKWGMVIDLNACTGCNACAVACQSENNVPVVGKDMVYRGREMHWLRIDRYFVGNENDPEVAVQPVMCVQCEEAPCENVCPVNATSHSPEGLNDMTYNRCIGTRYCSNNCPYKVRRFNYLNWHNDGPYQPRDPDVPETVRMQHNPNVTVRFRGVMEKCTYCVQRIQSTKIAAKRDNRPIRDGEIVTACQQTCPASAITFGDLNDERSRVAAAARNDRGYKLLAELGTQPRTTYLAKVRNPNPEMHG